MHNTIDIPLDVIATWPTPNYVDPETHGKGLLITAIIGGTISIVVMVLRIYSRFRILKAVGLDDVLAIVTWITTTGLAAAGVTADDPYNLGRHIWDVPPSDVVNQRLCLFIGTIFYFIASAAIKNSVLLFYRRLDASLSRVFKYAIWAGLIFNTLYGIGGILATFLMCSPMQSYWMAYDLTWPLTHSHTCGDESDNLVVAVALGIFGDVYSTVIPLVMLGRMDLRHTNRWGLYALFGFGFVVVAAGIGRVVILAIMTNLSYDFTWYVWYFWLWTMVELYLALIAASLPALKTFFMKHVAPTVSSMKKNSKYWSSSGSSDRSGPKGLGINMTTDSEASTRKEPRPYSEGQELEFKGGSLA